MKLTSNISSYFLHHISNLFEKFFEKEKEEKEKRVFPTSVNGRPGDGESTQRRKKLAVLSFFPGWKTQRFN